MRIVVDIGHPAQVHLFRHFVKDIKSMGHEVLITSLDKDVALRLLREYGMDHVNLGSSGNSFMKKILSIPVLDVKMYRAVKDFKPDLFLGCASIRAAHVARWMNKPCVTFSDTEATIKEHMLYLPFVTYVCTPASFRRDFGKKQVRYQGYHELAYVHPKRFRPDESVLGRLGVEQGEKFFVLRFVSWQATHDIGHHGFTEEQKSQVIDLLKPHGKVFITSEAPLKGGLKQYEMTCPKSDLLSALSYAAMLVTESQTVATEAALLGTPVVRYNTYVGEKDMGNFIELEKKYELLYSCKDFNKAVYRIKDLLQRNRLEEEWETKRQRLLNEKIDVTEWMVEFVNKHWGEIKVQACAE